MMLSNLLGSPPNAVLRRHPVQSPTLPRLRGDLGSPPSDHNFVMLHAAFRASGGLLRGEDVAASMAARHCGDFVRLARLIVGREVFSLQWHDAFWVPMFQFEPETLALRDGPRRVLAELSGVFDGWTTATWFAMGNDWLGGHRPLDRIDTHLDDVLDAARADRFIANG